MARSNPGPALRIDAGARFDRDALEGELEARVEDRRPHALARLAHGAVGQADDREVGQARAHVDLDRDAPRIESVDGEGGDAGEHVGHARPRPVTVEGVNGNESAQGDARSGVMAQPLRSIGTDRVSHVTRSHLASPSCPPTCVTTSAASAKTSPSPTSSASATRSSRATTARATASSTSWSSTAPRWSSWRSRRGGPAGADAAPGRRCTSESAGRSAGWPRPSCSRSPIARTPPDLRFDAIGVVIDAYGKLVRLDHLEAAF